MKRLLGPVSAALVIASTANAVNVSVGDGSYAVNPGCGGFQPVSYSAGVPATPAITSALAGRPIPTNDWWSSLIWKTADAGTDANYSTRLHALPLTLKAAAIGMEIDCQHHDRAILNGDISHTDLSQHHDITVGLVGLNATETKVAAFSDWTVTTDWSTGTLQAIAGKGMPYVWFTRGAGGGDARVALDGGTASVVSNSNGIAVVLVDQAYYGLYAPTGSTWTITGSGTSTVLTNNLNSLNYFSVGLFPGNPPGSAAPDATTVEFYRARAYAVPSNTQVAWNYNQSAATVTATYSATTNLVETGNNNVNHTVLCQLPHHWLNSTTPVLTDQFDSIRGVLKVVDSNSFTVTNTYHGVIPALPLVASSASGFSPATLNTYQNELSNTTPGLGNTYDSGKEIAKLGQAAFIAEQTGQGGLRDHHVNAIRTALTNWLTANAAVCGDNAVYTYDATWGTLVGRPAGYGSDEFLNDHHFHYGYMIMGAALLAHFDQTWPQSAHYGGMVDLLVRDIASPGRNDTMFPFLRNFDVYEGHSWASGPGNSIKGNNQESSSEAMNAWAAIALWGEATGNTATRDLGAFLYSTELSSVQNYWFDVNNVAFARVGYAHKVTGILWGDGYDYQTYFNGNPEAKLGIQIIPVTGAALYLGQYPSKFLGAYNALVSEKGGSTNFSPFPDLIWSGLAVSDAAQAISLFNANPTYGPDNGESRAHTYSWIHNLAALGQVDMSVTADTADYAVFNRSGSHTYVAYNPTAAARTVHYSNGAVLSVPANSLVNGSDSASVSLTAPADNAQVTPGTNVAITATANPALGGSITQVQFYLDGSLLATDTAAPYATTYNNAALGNHTIYAVATDSLSNTVQSATVTLVVTNVVPPSGGYRKVPNTAPGGTDASISAAMSSLASDSNVGGLVEVLNTYSESAGLTLTNNDGTITVRSVAAFGDVAPTPGASIHNVTVNGNQSLTIDGFDITSTGFGVVYNGSAGSNPQTLRNCTIHNTTFHGIQAGATGLNLTLDNTVILNAQQMGIQFGVAGTLNLTSATVANSSQGGIQLITASGITVNANKSYFTGNNQGAFLLSATGETINATDSTFSANPGGGIAGGSGPLTANLVNCLFANNPGVSISFPTGTLGLTSCTLANNSVGGGNGGAIFIQGGTANIGRTLFLSNFTPAGGGAVYVTGGTLNTSSSVFRNNVSSAPGGAIRAADSNLNIVNTTFYGNDGPGFQDGIVIDPAATARTVYLTNNIFSGQGNAVQYNPGGSATTAFRLLKNLSDNGNPGGATSNAVVVSGTNQSIAQSDLTPASPSFYNPSSGDLRLNSTSPALGTGADQSAADAFFGAGLVTIPATDAGGHLQPIPPNVGAFGDQAVPATLSRIGID